MIPFSLTNPTFFVVTTYSKLQFIMQSSLYYIHTWNFSESQNPRFIIESGFKSRTGYTVRIRYQKPSTVCSLISQQQTKHGICFSFAKTVATILDRSVDQLFFTNGLSFTVVAWNIKIECLLICAFCGCGLLYSCSKYLGRKQSYKYQLGILKVSKNRNDFMKTKVAT